MKILQVIPRFNPKHGGGVDVVYNISKFLARNGHQVTIITTAYEFDENFANTIRKEGVEVIPFNYLFNYCLFIPSPDMNKWLAKNINNYDVVHLNGARTYQNNVVCKFAIQYNVPYILQAHGSVLRIVSRKKLKFAYDIFWGNKILKNVSKCIALSESEKEAYQLVGIIENKIEIVPNGVDISKFENLPERGSFRRKYNLGNNKLIIYLGRLHKSKGIDIIPEMFFELTSRLKDIRLVFVGPDDGYGEIIKDRLNSLKINDKILFTGFVSEEEKLMALVDGDVFVTPRFYGFPIAFLEAWACGLPVVTTNIGDKLEWIDGNVGYITEFDKYKLGDAVFNIFNDQKMRIEFRENCKKIISEKLNWEIIVKDIIKVYINVVN